MYMFSFSGVYRCSRKATYGGKRARKIVYINIYIYKALRDSHEEVGH